jgi:hypothetical protein
LAGGFAGLGGGFATTLAVVFPTARDEVFTAVFAVLVRRPRTDVLGAGALAVRVRLAAFFVAAARRAVVVLVLRVELLDADLVLALRLAAVRA